MLQEIIVYLILLFTALHILFKTFAFFKSSKQSSNCSSCSTGSCDGCSLKFDFESIKPNFKNSETKKRRFNSVNE